jgi:hypothetical protein
MRDIAQHVYPQVFGKYLPPVAAPQKKTDNQTTDNAAEKQYLEGTQLGRKLPATDGHGHERYQRTGHPKSGNDSMISISLREQDEIL